LLWVCSAILPTYRNIAEMPFKKGETPKGAKPFQKGQSGNPNGQPRKLPALDKLLANVLGEEKDGVTQAEEILKALQKQAKSGNVRAAEVLLERAYGKSKQQHEVSGIDGGPIAITTIQFIDEQNDTDKGEV
jgi:hypothetical protein